MGPLLLMVVLGVVWTVFCIHGINFLDALLLQKKGFKEAVKFASDETAITFCLRRYPIRGRIDWRG